MTTYLDGSTGAPAGTAVFPTLLTGYGTRPAWKVAAVDYHVGTPTGVTLKTPSTIALAGVTVDSVNHVVNVNASNVTLDGYDFSGNGGWQVLLNSGATNLTLKDSYFKAGSNNLTPVQAVYGGYVNLLNNTFDGGGASRTENAMFFAGAGATVEYNRFTNFANDGIDITQNGDFTIKYNDFDNMNLGSAAHTDAIQTYFSAIKSLDVEFNTMYEPPNEGTYNSFIRIGDQQGNAVHNPLIAYNTIVTKATSSGGAANIFQIGADDGAAGTALLNPTIHDNYIDPSGTLYAVVSPEIFSSTNPNVYGNVNLTGSPSSRLLVGPYNSWSSGMPSAPTEAPTVSADRIVNGTRHALSGTAPSGTTVDVFDVNTLLGTTKAGSTGSWSFTTAALAAGTHAFSATATDAYANTSARSAVLGSVSTPPPPPGGGTTSTTELLFAASTTPVTGSDTDPNQVELGVKFSSAKAGTITGVSYYKSPTDTGTHTGALFSSTGATLATGTFTKETSSGWQTLTFAKPVAITAGTTYVAAFHSNGHYADTVSGFATAHVSGNLTAPVNAGVYSYGASGVFPTSVYGATNYAVSTQFVPSASTKAAVQSAPLTQTTANLTTLAAAVTPNQGASGQTLAGSTGMSGDTVHAGVTLILDKPAAVASLAQEPGSDAVSGSTDTFVGQVAFGQAPAQSDSTHQGEVAPAAYHADPHHAFHENAAHGLIATHR